MTLSSLTTKTTFSGDGSTTSFATGFVFWNSSDLKIILVSSSGGETTYTEGTHYSVTGGLGASGTVSVSSSVVPESGEDLLIKSNVALLQGTDLPTGGQFNSEDVESELDRMVRRIQQQSEQFDRTPQLAEGSTTTGVTLPNPSSGYVLGWSTDANFENLAVNSSAYLSVPIPIASGGTGAASASSARYALGVAIGTDVQAYDADLTTLGGLTKTDGNFIVADGSSWTVESSSVARASIGLSLVSSSEADAGTATTERSWTPERVGQAITALAADGTPAGTAGQYVGYSSSNGAEARPGMLDNGGNVTGAYYNAGGSVSGTATLAVTVGRLYFRPFKVFREGVYDRIGVNVTATSTGTARVGIYEFSSGDPQAIVLDAGAVSTASTGIQVATISQYLEVGKIYASAVVFSSTATVTSTADSGFPANVTYTTTPAAGTTEFNGYQTFAYSSLPDPFGSVTARLDGGASSITPNIYIRAA